MSMRFAYVGNDVMGAYVARQLAEAGWERVEDMASADAVFTYCTAQGLLEDAYFDDGGVVRSAQAGTLLVDLSPSTPAFARELSAVAAVNDLHPVEAPIAVVDPSGPDAFATADNFVCYLAGEEDDMARAREAVEALASTVRVEGGAGSAQLAKATHTVQLAAHLVAAVEAQALVRSTRESATSVDRLGGEVAALNALADNMVQAIEDDDFETGYPIEFIMADVAAAMTAADDVNLILPQLESALHLLELVAVIGGADQNPAVLSLLYREEEASAAHGLDWTRAEGLYGTDDEHDHHHHDGYGDPDDYDGYDDYDDFGMTGGFGGFSAN